jgi:hypothetical protein
MDELAELVFSSLPPELFFEMNSELALVMLPVPLRSMFTIWLILSMKFVFEVKFPFTLVFIISCDGPLMSCCGVHAMWLLLVGEWFVLFRSLINRSKDSI